jgi:superfamily II DNA or RNA helicase
MAKLEDLKPGMRVRGIIPGQSVSVVDAQWRGPNAIELIYKRDDGQPGAQLLFRNDETSLELAAAERKWDFTADGGRFRLAAEAYRIHLAHLFDPVLAVHTSLIEPLPHQITGVYGEMLPRQPLRFLLADDPGAGKTIMAGLLVKELMARGDVQRCLICVPGNLADQWQDELWFKFQLRFTILTRDVYEAAVSGNAFLEHDLAIIRLDQVARNERLQDQLRRTEWDVVIVDEAHKMSAHFWGNKLEETKRYKLGELMRETTRHFLLMTATPHNGKEEDFQLFLRLLDQDRFEGRFREGVHQVNISDIMRRMIKEDLVRFNGEPLFPERRAYTVSYPLSPEEAQLYDAVTSYVREEFNRADQLLDDKRRGTVGFALTILQRRLASSPEAIYQSLRRRRERLEKRMKEVETSRQRVELLDGDMWTLDEEDLEYLEDAPAEELEAIQDEVLDSATAALTIAELEAEIEILKGLERAAYRVLHGGVDRKWEELATIIQDNDLMFDGDGRRRKLVLFTEHRDTLNYLWKRIGTLFGRDDPMVRIDGGVPRDQRRAIEDRFRNDPDVHYLLATDAAGEGINLQRAHLMINYDLPWNPNRLEQRFGRIHRIGQTEVCHLWNLVAGETREGYVYERLLRKLETESAALKGKVFNVLGDEGLFRGASLRKLLLEAIRYGDLPEVRARLEQAVEDAFDPEHVRTLLEAESLAADTMDTSEIMRIREDMERYAARRLQPHDIRSFFLRAFDTLGGRISEREPGLYTISYVPARIRNRAKERGTTVPVWERYERVCFDKERLQAPGLPLADFICPGHPLMDTVVDLVLDKHREVLRSGAVLVDETDPDTSPRVLIFLEQSIRDARPGEGGDQRTISREAHFVEIDEGGRVRTGGHAPYRNYRPATEDELAQVQETLSAEWLAGDQLERYVIDYAVEDLIPRHLERVRARREEHIEKTRAAVRERLTKEINYWDHQANMLREDEKAGKPNAAVNRARAEQRADELADRLERRVRELELAKQISATPPVVIGGAVVIPIGLFLGDQTPQALIDTRITEAIAMQAVMEAEIALGNHPRDVSHDNLGYDIESLDPREGRLRFIEVKGRRAGAETVTVTHNEIMAGIKSPESFILALVEVEEGEGGEPVYVRRPFTKEPDFGVTSVNYGWKGLWEAGMKSGTDDVLVREHPHK